MKAPTLLLPILLLAACNNDEPPPKSDDVGGSRDFYVALDAPAPRQWTTVRVDDNTPTGQGLPLDAVEICNSVGMGCVALEVQSSSDDALDYAGAQDGPNSQDDTCTETTFTRLGGMGSYVVLARPDAEPISKGSQINVWTATSACTLVEAGDKAFGVSVGDADGEVAVEDCVGTCTVTAP